MKNILKFFNKKFISVVLIFTLLLNTNYQAFAQLLPEKDSYQANMSSFTDFAPTFSFDGSFSKGDNLNQTLPWQKDINFEEMCNSLAMCAKENSLAEDAIVSLYLSPEELESEINALFPNIKTEEDLLNTLLDLERQALSEMINEIRKSYKYIPNFS